MKKFKCEKCSMEVQALKCGKCNETLVTKTIKVSDKDVQVSECPKGCGKIKSPQCCGQDMHWQSEAKG